MKVEAGVMLITLEGVAVGELMENRITDIHRS